MGKKILVIALFSIVTAGFLLGFVSYQKELRKTLSQEIQGEEPSIQPDHGVTTEETVVVPDLLNKTEEEAAALIQEAGLTLVVTTQYSDAVEKGQILFQRPLKSSEVFKGTEVTVTVSQGAYGDPAGASEEVTMPDLLESAQKDAEAKVKSLGLTFRIRKEYSESIPAGKIMAQEPERGMRMEKGSTTVLWVSLGEKPEEPVRFKMPSVVGLSKEDGEALLKREGYPVRIRFEVAPDHQVNRVISQSPSGGTEVESKSAVILVIGKKAEETSAPQPEPPGEPEEENPEEPAETPETPAN